MTEEAQPSLPLRDRSPVNTTKAKGSPAKAPDKEPPKVDPQERVFKHHWKLYREECAQAGAPCPEEMPKGWVPRGMTPTVARDDQGEPLSKEALQAKWNVVRLQNGANMPLPEDVPEGWIPR